jgi:hypothetical protein
MEAKLAPFYRGLDDFEEDWTEEQVAKALQEVHEQDVEEDVKNSVTERIKEEKELSKGAGSVAKKIIHRKSDARKDEEGHERDKRERRAYIGAIECPICFLVRPRTGKIADNSTTHPISTLPGAVSNQSVPNALFRSSEASQPSHISNLNLHAVHFVSRQTLV